MQIKRHFVGWDAPCLPEAAHWLLKQHGCDLTNVVAVTPGGRAGRRLLELLVTQAQNQPLVPPIITTAGHLPELLYQPHQPVASELTATLARVAALKRADHNQLAAVVPHPPDVEDFAGWVALANDLNQLHAQLAAELVHMDQVADRAANLPDFADEARWHALSQLQRDYEELLHEHGLIDQHAARFEAINKKQCATDRQIVLIAAGDLNSMSRAMLEQIGDRVTALIHAPQSHADGFDELGCINIDYWHDRPLAIETDQAAVVDQPRDQAAAALHTIAKHSNCSADQITLGLGDETLAPMIERTLGLANLPARAATGRPIAQTGPATLLAALCRYMQSNRLDDFAALARHPDMQQFLGSEPINLTPLDHYASEHLQAEIHERWLTHRDKTTHQLNQLHQAITELLPKDAAAAKSLPHWSEPIAQILRRVYADRDLQTHRNDEQSLETWGNLLREQAAVNEDDAITPRLTLAEAIGLSLSRIAGQFIVPEGGDPAIELLGWLELQLDDAPLLIITGVNEGKLPRSVAHDVLLPDQLRSQLGLPDSRRIFARDRMMLEAMIHSRDTVQLISGRRGLDNDPLTPSRLLLACDDEQLPQWVSAFYGNDDQAPAPPAPLLMNPGRSGFVIPVPKPPDMPLPKLHATAFRDYLQCPYRFYLKHILKLKQADDNAVEMDGRAFGNLAHAVLTTFGQSDARNLEDPVAIEKCLTDQLDKEIRRQFGKKPRTAVQIQQYLLQRRLAAFAQWQAVQHTEGWRIECVENDLDVVLQIDDQPFTIYGRIDRIDKHDKLGCRILDYKTSDTAKLPDKVHLAKNKDGDQVWTDLQLPLYQAMAQKVTGQTSPQLGYVNLPKKLGDTGLSSASWSDLQIQDAMDRAIEIIRDIRNGVFWPPSDPPQYDDGFEGVCMDAAPDRSAIIEGAMQ